VRQTTAILLIRICLALFATRPASAQTALPSFGDTFAAHHTQAKLILSADTAKPGDTIWAGVDLKMEPGWHTYWKNPGDAGSPTKIEWTLPPGISAGEIQWPLPEKLPPAEVTTYGYENEVVLLVPLTLASNLSVGPLDLVAKVSWLECKESCIPASAQIQATLNVGAETKNSAEAAAIEMWKSKVPKPVNFFRGFGGWHEPLNGDIRSFGVVGILPTVASNFDFFPYASDSFEVQASTKSTVVNTVSNFVTFNLEKSVKKFSGDWPKKISGVIVMDVGRDKAGIEVDLPIQLPMPDVNGFQPISSNTSAQPPPTQPLWQMLLFAFIGGLILNIMPCVLPVIALKILGFVSEAKSEPRRVRKLGLIYALGVLLSFLALAAVVVGVKAAGHHAGWGMQFGSPVFIVCLTTLVTLVALNLFGIFEVTLGGRALDTAGELASKHGAAGAFFNGVLATVLATPCTAPFLGAALGFAFAQSASVIVLIFLTVGLGLASPYILLSWNPAWLKFLPKPGAWMEKFKIAMGFPMLATVVWLFNVAASSYGKNVLWLGIFLVVVAFAAWIFGEFFQRGRSRRGVALAVVLILLIGGYAFALEKELDWRAALPETTSTGSLKESADGIDWQPWSAEAVAQARAAGKPVLVDFTADWCLTCQVNKKTSIEVSSVREKLKSLNAVALLGDYTHFPDAITTELNRYNRAGVPLVLVYPKNADAAAIVLPEVLTPGIVLDALDRAAK
jgi:thiol:disulfide interchange protein DsbD